MICDNTTTIHHDQYLIENWKFNHSELKNHEGYLKSDDIINLSFKKDNDNNGKYIPNGQYEFLRSHNVQFTVENK